MISLSLFTLLLGATVAHLVFLLFFTDFVAEYGKVLNLDKLLKLDEYKNWKVRENIEVGYPIFVRETFSGFFPKLLGCPFCLITFFSLVLSVFALSFYFIFVGFAAAFLATILFLVEKTLYKKFSE